MPQLIPDPWLMIIVVSWATLLVVIPPKILGYKYMSKPEPEKSDTLATLSWTLPWT
uniref:ATP synthase complex subunit 8 n=1 Tax=Carapus dubius TaxID=2923460 RepID=A0AA96C3Y4_9TELE|nr:ATP synthase F0 subunit 8 [Carapus dubius]